MKELIKLLKERHLYIGVMESCTGGAIANAITNIPGASDVFKEGKVVRATADKNEKLLREMIKQKNGKNYGRIIVC